MGLRITPVISYISERSSIIQTIWSKLCIFQVVIARSQSLWWLDTINEGSPTSFQSFVSIRDPIHILILVILYLYYFIICIFVINIFVTYPNVSVSGKEKFQIGLKFIPLKAMTTELNIAATMSSEPSWLMSTKTGGDITPFRSSWYSSWT